MTTIDWTKPVETTEDPPRLVTVLYALGNDTPYGFVVFNITREHADEFWIMTDENRPTLRNVAPPKPKPEAVRQEGWVKLYAQDGQWPTTSSSVFTSEDDARESVTMREPLAVCKVAWMSDGSPVPGEDNYWRDYAGKMADAADRAEEDNNSLKAERDSAVYDFRQAMEIVRQYAIEMKELKAEIVRMTSQ